MKTLSMLAITALSVTVFAQNQRSDSASMKLVKDASDMVTAAVKTGKKVTISVDNRLVDYAPRMVKGRLLVPARLFNETGQRVLWTGADKRGVIRDDKDPARTVEMDAREPKFGRATPAMRPYLENGRLWVPLTETVSALGHTLTFVKASNRLNITTNRGNS